MWVTYNEETTIAEGYYWVDTKDPADMVSPGVIAPALWNGRWEIAGVEGGTPVYQYWTVAQTPPSKEDEA